MGARITSSDLELFGVLADYRVLTASQAAFVLKRNSKALRRRLGELGGRKLVDLFRVPASQTRGRPANLYSIARQGYQALLESGGVSSACGFEQVDGESVLRLAGHKFFLNVFRLCLVHAERQISGLSVQFHAADSPVSLGPYEQRICRIEVRDEVLPDDARILYPDAVVAINHDIAHKTVLFFLEVDMGTEPITRKGQPGADIAGKIRRYQAYFASRSYKEYEAILQTELNGFRVLFLADAASRQSELCRAVRAMPPSQFIWAASFEDLRARGISGAIWVKGGKAEEGQHSILGRYSQDVPLPDGLF